VQQDIMLILESDKANTNLPYRASVLDIVIYVCWLTLSTDWWNWTSLITNSLDN